MDIIDAHQHLYSEPGSLESLVKRSEEAGIVKVCLSACGEQYRQPGNNAIKKAFELYPDLIVGLGYVRLGIDSSDIVERLQGEGFRGIKVINPRKNYSDDEFYPIYEKAAEHKMPILFHTGVVARLERDGEFDTASERMRPIFLDRIARAFPKLVLIGAHLGVPWIDEACWVAKVNPNVYFDLSGVAHLLSKKTLSFFENLTGWESAKEKLVFGVDSSYTSKKTVIENTKKLMVNSNFSEELAQKVFYRHMARILGF